jgi:tRNA(Arg) A34 adenosine deaminase TadA
MMAWQDDSFYLRKAVEVSKKALETGNDAFGCILVDPAGNIIMEQPNLVGSEGATAHDAITCIKKAAQKYDSDYLWQCTLYATIEPCCMCMGAAYWANLGNVKFAMSEKQLGDYLGGMAMDLPSRQVVDSSSKAINITGPFEEVIPETLEVIKEWLAKLEEN